MFAKNKLVNSSIVNIFNTGHNVEYFQPNDDSVKLRVVSILNSSDNLKFKEFIEFKSDMELLKDIFDIDNIYMLNYICRNKFLFIMEFIISIYDLDVTNLDFLTEWKNNQTNAVFDLTSTVDKIVCNSDRLSSEDSIFKISKFYSVLDNRFSNIEDIFVNYKLDCDVIRHSLNYSLNINKGETFMEDYYQPENTTHLNDVVSLNLFINLLSNKSNFDDSFYNFVDITLDADDTDNLVFKRIYRCDDFNVSEGVPLVIKIISARNSNTLEVTVNLSGYRYKNEYFLIRYRYGNIDLINNDFNKIYIINDGLLTDDLLNDIIHHIDQLKLLRGIRKIIDSSEFNKALELFEINY